MTEYSFILPSAINLAFLGVIVWILKKWLGTKIEATYEQQNEAFSAAIRRDQEASLIAFRDQLEKQAQLQSSAFSSFAAAQQASMNRRLDAAETLWNDLLSFRSSLPPVFDYLDILTEDEFPEAMSPPRGQELFDQLSEEEVRSLIASHGIRGDMGQQLDYSLERVRPYVSEYLWSIFLAYKKIMFRIWLSMAWFKTEGGDHIFWYRDRYTRSFIESVLTPDELADFDQARFGKISELRFKLEQKIVDELRRMVSGETSGSDSLQQARQYQQLAREGLCEPQLF